MYTCVYRYIVYMCIIVSQYIYYIHMCVYELVKLSDRAFLP